MWFKNLVLYRLTQWTETADTLSRQLARQPLLPCGGGEVQRHGWLPPQNEDYVHSLSPHLWITLGTDRKLLPASVIAQQAQIRSEEFEQQRGYKPGRKQIKDIKDGVVDELLPRAFSVQRRTHAWINPEHNWMIIDSSSSARAEELLEVLRKGDVTFGATPLRTRLSPLHAMTEWLIHDSPPHGFTIDRDCEWRARQDERMKVRYAHHTLNSQEMRQHVQSGKDVTRLALTWAEKISFVLDDTLQLRRIAPLDILTEREATEDNGFDADFALMTIELTALIEDLIDALDGLDER